VIRFKVYQNPIASDYAGTKLASRKKAQAATLDDVAECAEGLVCPDAVARRDVLWLSLTKAGKQEGARFDIEICFFDLRESKLFVEVAAVISICQEDALSCGRDRGACMPLLATNGRS